MSQPRKGAPQNFTSIFWRRGPTETKGGVSYTSECGSSDSKLLPSTLHRKRQPFPVFYNHLLHNMMDPLIKGRVNQFKMWHLDSFTQHSEHNRQQLRRSPRSKATRRLPFGCLPVVAEISVWTSNTRVWFFCLCLSAFAQLVCQIRTRFLPWRCFTVGHRHACVLVKVV